MWASVPEKVLIAGLLLLAVVVLSFLSKLFVGHDKKRYSDWFLKRMNALVEQAQHLGYQGDQDKDPKVALQHYTSAISILETLRQIVSDETLSDACQLDPKEVLLFLHERRNQVAKY